MSWPGALPGCFAATPRAGDRSLATTTSCKTTRSSVIICCFTSISTAIPVAVSAPRIRPAGQAWWQPCSTNRSIHKNHSYRAPACIQHFSRFCRAHCFWSAQSPFFGHPFYGYCWESPHLLCWGFTTCCRHAIQSGEISLCLDMADGLWKRSAPLSGSISWNPIPTERRLTGCSEALFTSAPKGRWRRCLSAHGLIPIAPAMNGSDTLCPQ